MFILPQRAYTRLAHSHRLRWTNAVYSPSFHSRIDDAYKSHATISHLRRGDTTPPPNPDDDHRTAINGRPAVDATRVRTALAGGHHVRPIGDDARAGRQRFRRSDASLSRRQLLQLEARERHIPELDRLQCKGHGTAVQDRQPGDQSLRGQNGATGW